MSRLVFSFSLPEESEAAWILKQWKRKGKVLSHVIQKAIECDARELNRLEKDLEWNTNQRIRAVRILNEVFGVCPDDFRYHGHAGAENDLQHHQPADILNTARLKLKSRHEWTLDSAVVWE